MMLGLERLCDLWRPAIEDMDEDEYQRDPLTAEQQAALRRSVRAARDAYSERLRLEVRERRPVLRATGERPQCPGNYLCRQHPGQPWMVVEVLEDARHELWFGWSDSEPARPVRGSNVTWLMPMVGAIEA